MKIKISNQIQGLTAVIPVFNAEKYLRECLDSIINEEIESLNIILIDDGSTDGSLDICVEYSRNYDYISYIHKSNEGPGIARNIGIDLTKSKYLMFVDADDMLKSGSGKILNELVQQEFEICFLGCEHFYTNGKTTPMNDKISAKIVNQNNRIETLEYLSTRPRFPGSPCTKIFNTAFLQKNLIYFPTDKDCIEDLLFVFNAIRKASAFYAVDDIIYRYRHFDKSSRSNNLANNYIRIMNFIDMALVEMDLKSNDISQEDTYLLSFLAYEYLILLLYLSVLKKLNSGEYKVALNYLIEKRWLLRYAANIKLRVLKLFSDIFGIENCSALIGLVKKIK